jgi:hypothetical protein
MRGGRAKEISHHFDGDEGTFVLLNGQTGEYLRHDSSQGRLD